MIQNTPTDPNGLSPAATKQVLDGLVAGLEDLGDALTILLPLFRSLAYRDPPPEAEALRADLSGGDGDLILSIYDRWLNDSNQGLALLQVLFRSVSFREQAEIQQRQQGREFQTIPLTWSTPNPLVEQMQDTQGDAELAQLAIDKAQHAQMLLLRTRALLERGQQDG